MEVTVTIPDSLFEQVESLACQQEKTHSALVVQALQNLVESADENEQTDQAATECPQWLNWSDEETTRSLNQFATEHDTTIDPGLASAQTRALQDKWEWD